MLTRRGFLVASLAFAWPAAAEEEEVPWARLRAGGIVLLMRHGATDMAGDPPGHRLDDCRTQSNLSAEGREQARRVGARLREGGVRIERVYTSPWCRCRETARLAFDMAEDWAPLGSTFDAPELEREDTERVRKRIAGYVRKPPHGVVVMVTHNVNIAALTKFSVAPAELVPVKPDGCCSARPLRPFRLVAGRRLARHSSSPERSHLS